MSKADKLEGTKMVTRKVHGKKYKLVPVYQLYFSGWREKVGEVWVEADEEQDDRVTTE